MASIAENLRATLLSLKQISDRIKSLITTSVTKSEATANKNAVLTAIDAAKVAMQGNDTAATLTALKTAIAALNNPTVAQIQNGLAKETQVKDGNDTAISVGKEVRSELGTGSDTAAETGTLFAVVKWIKNKVNAISGYALQGSGNSTQTDIATAIGTPATGQPNTLFAAIAAGGGGGGGGDATAANQQTIIAAVSDNGDTAIDVIKDVDTYGAKEAAATANKNEVISAIGDTLSVNMLATGLSAMAGVPMNVITDDGTTTAYTLNANELYYFNNRSSDLNLTLDLTTVTQGEAADFHFMVQVLTGPLTVTIKDSNNNDVVWSYNLVPDFSSGDIYEIGIINNLALFTTYAV